MAEDMEFYFGEEEKPQPPPAPKVEQKPKEDDMLNFAEQVQMGEQQAEAPKTTVETPAHEDIFNLAEQVQQSVAHKVDEAKEAQQKVTLDTETILKSVDAGEDEVRSVESAMEELKQKTAEAQQEAQHKIEEVRANTESAKIENSAITEIEQPSKTEQETLIEAMRAEFRIITEKMKEAKGKLKDLEARKEEFLNEKKMAINKQDTQKAEQIELKIQEIKDQIILIERGEEPGNLQIEYYKKDKDLYNQLTEIDEAKTALFKEDEKKNKTSTGAIKPGAEFPSKEYYAKYAPLAEQANTITSAREQARRQFKEQLSKLPIEAFGLDGLEDQRKQLLSEYKRLKEEQSI